MDCTELREVLAGLHDVLTQAAPSEDRLQELFDRLSGCAMRGSDDYVCRKCENLKMELAYFRKLIADPARQQEAEDRRVMLLGEADMLEMHLDC